MKKPIPFGRFLLVERIAIGGMAEVFVAVERGDREGRLYAVKRILPTLADDDELVRMFLDEARVVARLEHPGIVPIRELGTLGERHYIAMDYVAGRDLRAVADSFRRGGERLPVELAVHITARAADALDHAHRARGADGRELRIVHRDVSPSNVLVGFDGTVRLIDFGLAQAAAQPRLASAPALRGKFAYMSPEMLRRLAVDRRSDVFALGVVLHELLTGERLFAAPTAAAVIEKVRSARAPPPSAANLSVRPELDRAVLRALAREPRGRFAWASDLRDALLPWAAGAGPGGGAEALARLMAERFPEALRVEQQRIARARRCAALA